MQNKKGLYIILVILFLAGLWLVRFYSLNNYYSQYTDKSYKQYPSNEWIEFGDDYLDYGVNAKGYLIRIDDFKIIDGKEFVDQIDYCASMSQTIPDKMAIITISLYNKESTCEGVLLTELSLHGYDSMAHLDWNMLDALNPILDGNVGIHLDAGDQCSIVLPYELTEDYYKKSVWENIEYYCFYLRVTEFPMEKDILLTNST